MLSSTADVPQVSQRCCWRYAASEIRIFKIFNKQEAGQATYILQTGAIFVLVEVVALPEAQ